MSNYCPAPKHLTSLTLSFWCVCCDSVEDVDQDKEQSDEQSHPPGHNVGGNEEADPGGHDEHAAGEVPGDDVVRHLPLQSHPESSH